MTRALQDQMDRLVSRIHRNAPDMAENLRDSVILPPTPARFKSVGSEREMLTEADKGGPPSYSKTSATLTKQFIPHPVSEQPSTERRSKGSGIHGMLLRGVVTSHGPCPKCSLYVLNL